MEGDAPAVIGDTSCGGSMGRSVLRYKRLGEAYPSGIGLRGSLLQETGKKYVCISHETLRMIKVPPMDFLTKVFTPIIELQSPFYKNLEVI